MKKRGEPRSRSPDPAQKTTDLPGPGRAHSTCFEPAIGRESIFCFPGSVPVLAEHRGPPDEQLPFLAFKTWSHLQQSRRECEGIPPGKSTRVAALKIPHPCSLPWSPAWCKERDQQEISSAQRGLQPPGSLFGARTPLGALWPSQWQDRPFPWQLG